MPVTTRSIGSPVRNVIAATDDLVVLTGEVRIRMNVQRSGLLNGEAWPPKGGEMVLAAEYAAKLIRNGLADLVAEPIPEEPVAIPEPEPEEQATVEEPVEKAIVPRRRQAHTGGRQKSRSKE